jgi:hypothetical protein
VYARNRAPTAAKILMAFDDRGVSVPRPLLPLSDSVIADFFDDSLTHVSWKPRRTTVPEKIPAGI